jgi:hypothetical protein
MFYKLHVKKMLNRCKTGFYKKRCCKKLRDVVLFVGCDIFASTMILEIAAFCG